MKNLNRKLSFYSIFLYFVTALFLIGVIVLLVWVQMHQNVSIHISEDLGSTQIITQTPLTSQTFGIILIIVTLIILLVIIIIQIIQKRKLVNEVSNISEEMIKSGIEPLTGDYDYVEFDNIKNAYNAKIMQIAEQVKRKDDYFGMTVHDLKVPIQSVKSNISLLEKFPNDKDLIVDLREELNYLESEVSRYLILEKIDYFEKANIVTTELNMVVKNIIKKYVLEDCNVHVEYGDDTIVQIDVTMFEKIVINLVQNAIHNSSDRASKIVIKENSIVFENNINGPIPEIFTKTRKKSNNGNGFGTQIIQKYIKLQDLKLEEVRTESKVSITIRFKDV